MEGVSSTNRGFGSTRKNGKRFILVFTSSFKFTSFFLSYLHCSFLFITCTYIPLLGLPYLPSSHLGSPTNHLKAHCSTSKSALPLQLPPTNLISIIILLPLIPKRRFLTNISTITIFHEIWKRGNNIQEHHITIIPGLTYQSSYFIKSRPHTQLGSLLSFQTSLPPPTRPGNLTQKSIPPLTSLPP